MITCIKNGLIVDGSGEEPFVGNLIIENDKIRSVNSEDESIADLVIDARGFAVAPGFIDTHSHSDLVILEDSRLLPKVMQGITTEVLGQDGISMAPLPEEFAGMWGEHISGLDGFSDNIDWNYRTTENYLKNIENKKSSTNVCYLIPHGNVRLEGMGFDNRLPSEEELEKMCEVLRREMEAGGIGLSTGLVYTPCAYSNTEELIALCKVVAEFDGVFVVHLRSEGVDVLDALDEVFRIGRESGVKVHISHFKMVSRVHDEILEKIEKAEADGVRFSFDQHPYIAGSTMMAVILPPWAHDGGTEMLLKRLEDPELREKMRYDIDHGLKGWDSFLGDCGIDGIYVSSVKSDKNEWMVGKNLHQIGDALQKDPYDCAFDLIYEEKAAVGLIDFFGKEEDLYELMKRPEMNPCTDGLLGGRPHPRAYGTFPRILGKYCREEKLFNLQTAIYKMTKKPAEAMDIKNRGQLVPGYFADVVIFDADTIIDKSTYLDSMQFPEGISHVFVNGELIVKDGEHQGLFPGKVLYRKLN